MYLSDRLQSGTQHADIVFNDESTELGSVESLIGGSRSANSPATTLSRLQKFQAQLRAVSLPDELQVYLVEPQRAGSRVVGWYLGKEARHEVQQITHETGGRLVADSLLDSTTPKDGESTEERTPSEAEALRVEALRAAWDTYPHELRRQLKRRHAALKDLPA